MRSVSRSADEAGRPLEPLPAREPTGRAGDVPPHHQRHRPRPAIGAAGAIAQPNTAPTRPSTTASTDGRGASSGSASIATLVDHSRIGRTVAFDSTYVKAHRSAAGAQKKAARSSHWRLPRRSQHQDPSDHRAARPADRPPPDARPSRRHPCRARSSSPGPALPPPASPTAPTTPTASAPAFVRPTSRRSSPAGATAPTRSATTSAATERWRIEATFCRLKDFRRVATRYDKLARLLTPLLTQEFL